jgi:D-glycero-D-manno-heptose 1,7-bisphosphate phosphatase
VAARAVFLDRDGVLIEDNGLVMRPEDICVMDGAAEALRKLSAGGYLLIVVSNQAVVARGMMTEDEVVSLQGIVESRLRDRGAPALDGFFYCPHHPNATLPAYRQACDCRKPRPGLLLAAAKKHGIDTESSWMVGDRITDIIAGARAGCRTVLLESGMHRATAIETPEPLDPTAAPDMRCASLADAAERILGGR